MIYPDSFESKIGFDVIRRQIRSLCGSDQGGVCCDEMQFVSDKATVVERLEQTAEMLEIISGSEPLNLGTVHDLRTLLAPVGIEGAYLSTADMVKLRDTIETVSGVVRFFNAAKDDNGLSRYPCLDAMTESLTAFPQIGAAIDRVIDRWGEVKDNASPHLADIRRSLASMSGTINSIVRRVVAAAVRDGLIDADAAPSVRDGRLVIPVPPMNKRKIQGIVHDESATGKTVFIEPAEAVEVNNRLRELEIDERREIAAILKELTQSLRPWLDDLLAASDTLGRLDFVMAKAVFARDNKCCMPASISDNIGFDWHDARHPVLSMNLERQGKRIVPLDLRLTAERRIIVVSGPNAGGKSVVLKTAAVIQYMLQCGLLPSMSESSVATVYESIFIDIGDDQSIEDDLSTYSSHLRNMKFFLARGNDRTMILIDEFGAGTEPQIGGAIAQALLRRFNEKRMSGIITTHFRNLKLFAEETPGLVNGSMLYDRQLMQPLFRLSVGNAGSSFAVEIARKTGLPEDVIHDAEEIVGSDYVNADKYLLDINRDKRYWENKRQNIRLKEKKLEELLQRYHEDAERLSSERKQILAEAREKARQIIDESNAAVERTIREIKQAQADKERTTATRQRLSAQRRELDETAGADQHPLLKKAERHKNRRAKNAAEPQALLKREIAVGDVVILDGSGAVGKVTEISGKKATVVFGNLTTTTSLERLSLTNRKIDNEQRKAAASSFISVATREDMRERQLNFKQEIDVRGMRVDEALQAVTYFIDDAVQFNSQRVRILHGTGTGALRQAIREYLDSVVAVRRYHDEDVRFGGAGITVVEF